MAASPCLGERREAASWRLRHVRVIPGYRSILLDESLGVGFAVGVEEVFAVFLPTVEGASRFDTRPPYAFAQDGAPVRRSYAGRLLTGRRLSSAGPAL